MAHLIEVHVRDIHSLLHRSGSALANPGPDPEAMAVLIAAADHAPPKSDLAIRIRSDDGQDREDGRVARTLARFFEVEAEANRRDLRRLLRVGWRSLLLGFLVTAILLAFAEGIHALGFGRVLTFLAESLIIVAWVALWRPAELFLFDLWPLRRRGRLLARLIQAPVEVVHSTP